MLKRSALAFFCWCMKGGVVKRKQGCAGVLVLLGILVETLNQHVGKRLRFCKESSEEKRQLRFGIAKAAVLHCKTAAFTVQNLRFWNAKQ